MEDRHFLYELNDADCDIRTILQNLGRRDNWINKHIDKYRELLSYYIDEYYKNNKDGQYSDKSWVRVHAKAWEIKYKVSKLGSNDKKRWHLRIIDDLPFMKKGTPWNESKGQRELYIYIPFKYLQYGHRVAHINANTIGGRTIADDDKVFAEYKRIFAYQAKMLNKINIDADAATNDIDNLRTDRDITYHSHSIQSCSIKAFSNKLYKQSWSTNTYRIYNTFTYSSKAVRKHLALGINKIYEIDIKNCQPLILAHLLDSDKMKEMVQTGTFYKDIFDLCKEAGLEAEIYNEFDKDKFKVHLFKHLFFSNTKTKEPRTIKKVFKDKFGDDVYNKLISYDNLSVELQRIESELMLINVGNELIDADIPFLTLHDAVYTTSKYVQYVTSVIKKVFRTHLNIEIQTTEYNPFELLEEF